MSVSPKFPRANFVWDFFKYRLVGCPEHRSGMLCSSSIVIVHIEPPSLRKRSKRGKKGPFGDLGGPDLVPTALHWPAWVGLMVTTHFDLVLGPFWAPGGPKRAHFGPNVPTFHGPIFVGYFLCSKYSLVGCPEHHNGTPCSSSTVTAHMEPSSLRKQTPSAQLRFQTT